MNIQIGHDAALVESKKKLISGTYLRNAWYCAAWSEALGDGGVLGLTILKEPVVLYRQGNGEVVALEDRCAHRFAPLEHGRTSSAATASSAPITGWNTTRPAPACSNRTATRTSRRGRG